MLATHVWRTHEVWADEYRAYFGLRAKRGLVGTDTSAKLRAAANEYLVPHHEAAVELARAATRGKPCASAARGSAWRRGSIPPIRKPCATVVAAALRSCRSAERSRSARRLREQLRFRGPTRVVCTECGTTFLSRLRARRLERSSCGRGLPTPAKASPRGRLSETERAGRIATSARRRGSRAQLYELARARLSQSDPAAGTR